MLSDSAGGCGWTGVPLLEHFLLRSSLFLNVDIFAGAVGGRGYRNITVG